MTTRLNAEHDTIPSPFPEGWYFIATRRTIEKARLIQKMWMGENIVVWCDDAGNVCVADAYCPHLGSDMGPAAGGCVRDGRLVCPFHGFEYDATGQCVATPYAEAPRTATLRVYETHEEAGLIFAWWGLGGREPQWRLPEIALDQTGWSGLEVWKTTFPGHPQDTTENAVDLAHLRYVHGYHNVERVGKVTIDGPYLKSCFNFRTVRRIAKVFRWTLDLSVDTSVYGLGYSFVQSRERTIGMDVRIWVLATPVDGVLIDLWIIIQIGDLRKPRRWIAGLGFLPVKLRSKVMSKFLTPFQHKDVLQDVVIWSRKRYRSRPRLARSDGEIMPFRHYCAQFYCDSEEAGNTVPSASSGAAK
ncbi:MAG: Rieske 2Fe-2S domain-containing protein [Chloroflexota bacterium]|nr:Rieske 2Fe-2S domain-containing protein [Chloroflexota bacterium]MDE2964793.1 Rieske 2Fe-2S domain-containing protein [Acidobacteriota bacterium]